MNATRTMEDRLESTGAVLRDRPSVVDQVIAEIRQTVRDRSAKTKPDNTPTKSN